MLTSVMMVIAILASLVLPVVAVVGVVTYIRRTRRLEELGMEGSVEGQVLDSLDQVHVRLDAMNARLTRFEEALREGGDRILREGGERTTPPRVTSGEAEES